MAATTTGSLTGTGSVTHGKPPGEATAFIQISGTYGTVTFVIEGSFDGSNFFALAAVAESTGTLTTGTIAPTDNSTVGYRVPSEGLTSVRARATAVGSGTAAFALTSGDFRGQPLLAVAAANASTWAALQTFNAGIAFGGATTANVQTIPDNLADALNIKEGSNSYLKFVTTDNAEGVILGKKVSKLVIATPVAATGAGGGVSGAAQLGLANIVTISSDGATKGVKLKTGTAGDVVFVLNTSSTAANLFAASGGTINGASADVGCAIPASKGSICVCTAADTWTVFDFTAHAGAAA